MPESAEDIINRADTLVKELNAISIVTGNIYCDPLVQPISTDSNKGIMVLEAVRGIKAKISGSSYHRRSVQYLLWTPPEEDNQSDLFNINDGCRYGICHH